MKINWTALVFVLSSGFAATAAQAQFGAIAFDDSTYSYGFRVGAATAADAQNSALGWCRNTGSSHCRLLWTFDRACATFTVSQNRRNWFSVDNAGTREQQIAKTQADSVAKCAAAGGERCAPQVSMCSSDQNGVQFPNQAAVSGGVVNYAASHMGQMIGNGQCWSLVDAALAAAGAVRPGQRNFDTYVFGQEVYRNFLPGDILQFENVRFQTPSRTDNFPHHTAIVGAVNGNVLTIYQQNVNGDMHVQTGVIDMSTKVSGLIRAYRPIPQG